MSSGVKDALFGQKTSSFGNLTRAVFLNKMRIRLKKSFKELNPQITIPKSTKTGQKNWFLFHTIHTKTKRQNKNRLNMLSHRLLGGSLEVPTRYYVKIKIIWQYQLIKWYSFP